MFESNLTYIPSDERICSNCSHSEICKYKDDFTKTYNDIKKIGDDGEAYITVTIKCKHWNGRIHSIR